MTESEEETFHCIRCDKEVGLDDIFFDIWQADESAKKFSIHAACYQAHHDAIKKEIK